MSTELRLSSFMDTWQDQNSNEIPEPRMLEKNVNVPLS